MKVNNTKFAVLQPIPNNGLTFTNPVKRKLRKCNTLLRLTHQKSYSNYTRSS